MSGSSLPRTLGRYRILGELATGGMAEILLGRVDGRSGFSRPVVIKRILPHLAHQPSFVTMFEDEARIVAGIRHPNVVQVQELSAEDGELFLVMEYLEGESVSGLTKRLSATHRELTPSLAAYITAELCAGLHAAHELTDDRGVAQTLVHRDVSPQNVFVSYDGHVKLLDFGVALAQDRVTRTEAGQLKGKLQYMSPEQCSGTALDRRSDIFAVGIVLYELLTGRLLFKRSSSAATLRAICDEPVVPPSRIATVPDALEAICLRALARDRDDRFATCAEMRSALLDVVDSASTRDRELSVLMRELFADRIRDKLEMLRRVGTGADGVEIPPGETDLGIELPTVATLRLSPRSSTEHAPRPEPRRGRGIAWLAVAAAVAGSAVLVSRQLGPGSAVLVSRQLGAGSSADPTGPAARAPTTVVLSGDRTPGPVSPAAIAGVTAPAPDGAPAPATVAIEIVSVPRGATVRVDGAAAARGRTPLAVELPVSASPVRFELRLAGHVTQRRELVPDRAQRVEIAMPSSARHEPVHRKDKEGFGRFE